MEPSFKVTGRMMPSWMEELYTQMVIFRLIINIHMPVALFLLEMTHLELKSILMVHYIKGSLEMVISMGEDSLYTVMVVFILEILSQISIMDMEN